MWGLAWGLHQLPAYPGCQASQPLCLCLFIPGQLPALHSIFLLCFHGNTIVPGVHGPDRGEEEKGLDRSTRGRQSPGAHLSSEAPTGQEGAPSKGWQPVVQKRSQELLSSRWTFCPQGLFGGWQLGDLLRWESWIVSLGETQVLCASEAHPAGYSHSPLLPALPILVSPDTGLLPSHSGVCLRQLTCSVWLRQLGAAGGTSASWLNAGPSANSTGCPAG